MLVAKKACYSYINKVVIGSNISSSVLCMLTYLVMFLSLYSVYIHTSADVYLNLASAQIT